jgi:methionyl aminopeptidase
MAVEIKSQAEIEKMRATCRLAASVLEFIEPHVVPGVTTGELDRLCHDYIVKHGAYPSPLNYKGFPKSICTSVNEVICHGIPGKRELKAGDIINLDITTTLDGYFGDCSDMFVVGGSTTPEAQKLIDVTRESLWIGIAEVAPGKQRRRHRRGDLGVRRQAARLRGGRGVLRPRHRPRVPHAAAGVARGQARRRLRLKPGMTFTIEPMINLGSKHCDILSDGWTAVTQDKQVERAGRAHAARHRDGLRGAHACAGGFRPKWAS